MEEYDSFSKLCRTCLSETNDGTLRSIFKKGKLCGQITTMSAILEDFTSLIIDAEDGLPNSICSKCLISLSRAFTFKQQTLKAAAELNAKLNDIKTKYEQLFQDDKLAELKMSDEPESTGQDEQRNLEAQVIDISHDMEHYHYIQDTDIIQDLNQEQNNEEVEEEEEEDLEQELTDDISVDEAGKEDDTSFLTASLPEQQSSSCSAINASEMLNNTSSYQIDEQQLNESTSSIQASKIVFRTFQRKAKKQPPTFECKICSKILSNNSSYKYHMQLHSEKTPFLCQDCGAGFKTKNAYEGHRVTHQENPPNTCNICNKSYRQAASLRSHMLKHDGVLPFVCDICGKGCTQKSGYKKHMLTHTGEKPYSCDYCNRNFRYSSNLIIHKRSHTGDKPYSCSMCVKKFPGSEQLKRHSLVHTGERPFQCNFGNCNKRFNRMSSLKVHENLHTGVKNHVCPICHKSYIQANCLKTHIANIHKGYEIEIRPEEG